MRFDPYRELTDTNHMFRNFFGNWPGFTGGDTEKMTAFDWKPAVDISETPEAYVICAELPGAKREDVSLSVEDRLLTLRGERKVEKETNEKKFHRVERSYGSFTRSFRLPENVSEKNISASFNDGILEVKLMKEKGEPKHSTEVKIS
jgi:HSP20 family protein